MRSSDRVFLGAAVVFTIVICMIIVITKINAQQVYAIELARVNECMNLFDYSEAQCRFIIELARGE